VPHTMLTERAGLESAVLAPNPHGDWLNQRRDDFDVFLPIGEKDGGTSVFTVFSGGLKSNRDAWVYNSNSDAVEANVRRMIDTYEAERFKMRTNQAHQLVADPTLVAWSGGLTAALSRGQRLTYDSAVLHSVVYRPFERAIAYFDPVLNERRYRLPMLFPTRGHTNVGFYALNPGAEKPFSVLMVDQIPDLALYGSNAGLRSMNQPCSSRNPEAMSATGTAGSTTSPTRHWLASAPPTPTRSRRTTSSSTSTDCSTRRTTERRTPQT